MKKDDDVKRYVIKREIKKEGKKIRIKAPKIQRLITDIRIRRKKIEKVFIQLKSIFNFLLKIQTLKRREKTVKQKEEYTQLLNSIRTKKTEPVLAVTDKKDNKATKAAQEVKGKVDTKAPAKVVPSGKDKKSEATKKETKPAVGKPSVAPKK